MPTSESLRKEIETGLGNIQEQRGGDFGNPEQVQYYIDALNELADLYIEIHKDSAYNVTGVKRQEMREELLSKLWKGYFTTDDDGNITISPEKVQNAINRIKRFTTSETGWDQIDDREFEGPGTWDIANFLKDTAVLETHPRFGTNRGGSGEVKKETEEERNARLALEAAASTDSDSDPDPDPSGSGIDWTKWEWGSTPIGQSVAAEALGRGAGTEAQRAAMQGAMRAGGIHAGNPFEKFATQKLQGAVALWMMANAAAQGTDDPGSAGTLPDALSATLQGQNVPFAPPGSPGYAGEGYEKFTELNPYIAYSAEMANRPAASAAYMDFLMGQYQDKRNQYLGALATGDVVDTPQADFIRYVRGGPPAGGGPAG